MTAAAGLVRAQKVRADNLSCVLRDEDFVVFAEPICKGIVTADVSWKRVSLSCPQHRFQNCPDVVPVVVSYSTNRQHAFIFHQRLATRELLARGGITLRDDRTMVCDDVPHEIKRPRHWRSPCGNRRRTRRSDETGSAGCLRSSAV